MQKTSNAVAIKWVSKGQMRKILDARARRVVGLSGAAFCKKVQSGQMKALHCAPGAELMALCSFVGGVSAGANRKRGK